MEPTTFAYFILFLLALACIGWGIAEYGAKWAKLENEYNLLYKRIQYVINEYEVTDMTYDYIWRLIDRLSGLKYKDKEKTTVLLTQFLMKYKDIKKQRVKENE